LARANRPAQASKQEFVMVKRSMIVVCALMTLAACSKVNQENYDKLSAGMSKAEVENLLGSPADCSGAVGLTSCTWGDEKTGISVQFAADKVVIFSGNGLK